MGITEKQTNWSLFRYAIYTLAFGWAAIFPLTLPSDVGESLVEFDEVFTETFSATTIVIVLAMMIVFFAVAAGMLLVNFYVHRTLGNLPDPLVAPSHHRNPFKRNPFLFADMWEFWHFGGWIMLSAGAGTIVAGLWSSRVWLIFGILGLGLGATVLISMQIFMRLNATAQRNQGAG